MGVQGRGDYEMYFLAHISNKHFGYQREGKNFKSQRKLFLFHSGYVSVCVWVSEYVCVWVSVRVCLELIGSRN